MKIWIIYVFSRKFPYEQNRYRTGRTQGRAIMWFRRDKSLIHVDLVQLLTLRWMKSLLVFAMRRQNLERSKALLCDINWKMCYRNRSHWTAKQTCKWLGCASSSLIKSSSLLSATAQFGIPTWRGCSWSCCDLSYYAKTCENMKDSLRSWQGYAFVILRIGKDKR